MVAKQKRKSLGIIANINYNKSVSGGDRTPSQHASGNIRIASISNTTKSLITARSKSSLIKFSCFIKELSIFIIKAKDCLEIIGTIDERVHHRTG